MHDPVGQVLTLSRQIFEELVEELKEVFKMDSDFSEKKFEKQIQASAIGPSDSILSEKIYGRFFFRKKAICLSPIKGLSTHMTEGVMTPLIDWEIICKKYIEEMKIQGLWHD